MHEMMVELDQVHYRPGTPEAVRARLLASARDSRNTWKSQRVCVISLTWRLRMTPIPKTTPTMCRTLPATSTRSITSSLSLLIPAMGRCMRMCRTVLAASFKERALEEREEERRDEEQRERE